jgi:hypothetical protein
MLIYLSTHLLTLGDLSSDVHSLFGVLVAALKRVILP